MASERESRVTWRSQGSALVVVLWCIAILSIVVYGVLYAGRLELRVAKNYADSQQAYYLALAGIETAKVHIYEESLDRKTEGRNFRTRLFDDPESFRGIKLGRGEFDVFRGARDEEDPLQNVYGIRDEEACLNVNLASPDEMMKLPSMTAGLAAAIADWRDGDSEPTPEGAEADYYDGLDEPYRIRNAPFESLRELLCVRGVSEELLLAEDANANGILDPGENDGRSSYPMDNQDGQLDPGWSVWLTVHSGGPNENARGEERINIASATADEIADLEGVSMDLARGIVAYRERESFDSIGHLLDARAVNERQPGATSSGGRGDGPADPSSGGQQGAVISGQAFGEQLISPELFKRIADDITVQDETTLAGVVNVNTAPQSVLACLPRLGEEIAQSIVSFRQQRGRLTNLGELLDVPGMTREIFKGVCRRLTVRPGTYRILSEGRVPGTGARKRLEVVVRMTDYGFDTLYYREDP